MKVLMVFAHPDDESAEAKVLDLVRRVTLEGFYGGENAFEFATRVHHNLPSVELDKNKVYKILKNI